MRLAFPLIPLLVFVACAKKEAAVSVAPMGASDLVSRGKSSYMANCIACHNPNPKMDGSLGPGVAGASLEVLERRLVHGDYPANYIPKRKSKTMVALPHLAKDLQALHAYLNNL